MKEAKNVFELALKTIVFAWKTNPVVFLLIIALNICVGSIVYLQFVSFSLMVDQIIKINQGATDSTRLVAIASLLVISFLVPSVFANLVNYYKARFKLEFTLKLELTRIEKQGSLDISTIESDSFQNLLKSAKEWGNASMLNLSEFVFSTASNFAGIITSMIILWMLSAWLVLFAVLAAMPVYFFYKKYSMEVFRVRYLSVEDQRVISNRIAHFEELHKAVDVILLKLKEWLKEQIVERRTVFNNKILEAERKKSWSYSILSIWYLLFLFAAIALMTFYTLNGLIAVGALLLAFSTYTRFYQTINTYVESISLTEEAARYAARWFELIEIQPRISSTDESIPAYFREAPFIEFRNVCFAYPNENSPGPLVLNDLSFTIKPGEKIFLVGLNGSGKTTLIKLLCRVYDPSSGEILVNGTDLKKIRFEDWLNTLGVLFQDFPVYNVTMSQSMWLGKWDEPVEMEKIKRAAQSAGADEFIKNYDQLIWKDFQNGVDLSKGQHQRLAVGRMRYRDALITILDEPTASIDAITEEKILRSIEKDMPGKTVILITHRFSSVKNADKILVLEHGKLIGIGTHQELLTTSERYSQLYRMQAKGYREESKVETIA